MKFESQSQAGQDLWVWETLEHKTDGHYLDLGANHPTIHSNSYALELQGWSGILVDIAGEFESRKGTVIISDAANPNDRLKLYYNHLPTVVDYCSIDCDDATLGAFNALPWDKVTFRCITVEHDAYRKGPSDRDKMRTMLKALGYHLTCASVSVKYPEHEPPKEFEDWFCFPALCNPEQIKRFQSENLFWKDILAR